MNYIRYHEMEKLFAVWPELNAILQGILTELAIARRLKGSTGTDDDYIYSLCIGNKVIDNMPPSGRISDTTGNIASSYEKIMRYDRRSVSTELKGDALEISLVIDKLQLASRRLNPLQRHVLELYYWDGKTWTEIVEQIKAEGGYCSKGHVQNLRRLAMSKMANIIKIPIETYEFIMGIVEEKIERNS